MPAAAETTWDPPVRAVIPPAISRAAPAKGSTVFGSERATVRPTRRTRRTVMTSSPADNPIALPTVPRRTVSTPQRQTSAAVPMSCR